MSHHENARLTFAGRRALVSRITPAGPLVRRATQRGPGVDVRATHVGVWSKRLEERGGEGGALQSQPAELVGLRSRQPELGLTKDLFPQWLYDCDWRRLHTSLGHQAYISWLRVSVNKMVGLRD